jgi:hypothetical protein
MYSYNPAPANMEAIPLGNNLNQEAPWVKVNKD